MSLRGRYVRVFAWGFLVFVVAGVGAATAAVGLARQSYILDLFTHFRPYYLLALMAALAAAFLLRTRVWALVAIGLAAPHAWAMASADRAPHVASDVSLPTLRVLTFNVQYLNPHKELLTAYVRRANPDVILLQEVADGWQATVEALRVTHPYTVPTRPAYRGDNLTLSRHPIVDGAPLPAPLGGPNILRARISLYGRTLTVFNVHPLHPLAARMAASQRGQFAQLADSRPVGAEPYLIAGDFNMTPWSPHFADLLSATRTRRVAAARYWPSTWPANDSYGWLARRLRGLPIDHVLISEGLGVVGMKRGPALGSDHYPLLATLRFTSRAD